MLATPNAALGKILKDRWYGFHTSFEHVYFFSPRFLKKFFSNEGYETLLTKSSMLPSHSYSFASNSAVGIITRLKGNIFLRQILRPVKRAVGSIFEKLDVRSLIDIFVLATEFGFIDAQQYS